MRLLPVWPPVLRRAEMMIPLWHTRSVSPQDEKKMRMPTLFEPHKTSTSGAALCAALIAMLALVGCAASPATPETPAAPDWQASELVPLGESPRQGNPHAPVVIVEFSSLQCPFSARARQTVVELLQAYPDEVQLVYRHLPLSFQPESHPAALAAEAAREQGAFWPMVDSLYASQRTMTESGADAAGRQLAARIGLDERRYAEAIANSPELDARIQRDVELARQLGIQGTPTFMINGELVRGAQPREVFEAAITRALERHALLEAEGVPQAERYARSVALARVQARAQAERAQKEAARVDTSGPKFVVVPVEGDELIHQSGEDFLVTIVEFSSLQCPFCARALPTLTALKERYGEKLRVVFKHFPLQFHGDSELAARAVVAAQEQGKGWEMRDAIYARQRELGPELIDELATELQLDQAAFASALQSEEVAERVARQQEQGLDAGVRGTPSFFINGRFVVGAQPLENFEAIIDDEIERAQTLREQSPELQGQALYERLIEARLESAGE
ncbi:thioredoxin [Bradymonadaceae bacterium TMQ3]|nr:thioredoxin [Bradymonadaceae bacterium TMQ3]TXC69480.1 thioredoxin [Bradymonadales bacterium TMQ1]